MDLEAVGLSKWDLRFLKLADHVAQWSKDPSTKVGAVIVDSERRVVGMGYNGFPRGVADLPGRLTDRTEKLRFVVHAEVNAILNAVRTVEGCCLYTTPMFTCGDCAKVVAQAGILRVVSIQKPLANITDWALLMDTAQTIYDEAGIKYVRVTPEVLEHVE